MLASGRQRLYSDCGRTAEFEVGVGAGRPAVFFGLVWLALGLAPAAAADMSSLGIDNSMPPPAPVIAPGPTTYINFLDEARFGVYAHNWIHDEGSPVDVSGELLSSPIGYANNIGGPWFSWFFNPRINVGAMINTGGKTSYEIHRPHLAHSALQGVLLRGRVWRCGQHLAIAGRTGPRQHRLPLGFPQVGRLRLPVQRALGFYRQCRAHLAREPVHPHQPRPDSGRRADRV